MSNDARHLVIDVQVVMRGAAMSDPPDDGTCHELLVQMRACPEARLVWDSEQLIRSQYERKLRTNQFAWEWIQDLLVHSKIDEVQRARLTTRQSQKVRATGLVGEDLTYYVRTTVNSPERHLVTQDSDYDLATCRVLRRELGVTVVGPAGGCDFVAPSHDEEHSE